MAEDNDDAIPYCIATGDIKKLVAFFTGRGQLRQALIIAQVQKKHPKNNRTFLMIWILKVVLVNCVFFQGACEGNIRSPQTDLVNHMTNDVDNRQQYQRYF